jgi:hypothetical protein
VPAAGNPGLGKKSLKANAARFGMVRTRLTSK